MWKSVDDYNDSDDNNNDVDDVDFWNYVGTDVVGDDSNCDDIGDDVCDDVGDEDSYHAVTLNKCYFFTYIRSMKLFIYYSYDNYHYYYCI